MMKFGIGKLPAVRGGKRCLAVLMVTGIVSALCLTSCASSPGTDTGYEEISGADISGVSQTASTVAEVPADFDEEALRKASDLPVGKSIDINGIKVTKQTVKKGGDTDRDTEEKDKEVEVNVETDKPEENPEEEETGNPEENPEEEETGNPEESPSEEGTDKPEGTAGDNPADIPTENAQTDTGASGADTPAESTGVAIDDAAVADFFKNCVFAGDSVLLGFRNYCRSAAKPFCDIQFMAAGSYSLHNALWDVSDKSIHPLYKGEQMQLWTAVDIIKPERVFLFFGINDMVYGVEDSADQYVTLINKITETAPDTRIYILSATYLLDSAEKKKLNNDNLATFNALMAGKAQENGWGYIDLATPLSDGNGNLNPDYCSDGELHQNKKAYDVWVRVLSEYASGGAQ